MDTPFAKNNWNNTERETEPDGDHTGNIKPHRVAPRRRLGKVSRAAGARGGGTGVAPGPAEDDTKIAPSPWSRRRASATTVARRECPGADQIPMSQRHAVNLACSRHDPAISCTDHENRSAPVSEARRQARHARDRAPYWLRATQRHQRRPYSRGSESKPVTAIAKLQAAGR